MIIQVNNFMRLDSTTGAPKIFLWVLSRGKRRLHNQGFMAGFMAWKPFSVAMSPLTVPRVGTSKLGLAAGPPGILAGIASIALVPLYQCNGIWYLGIKSKRHLTSYSWHISGHITICTHIIIYNYIIIHIYIYTVSLYYITSGDFTVHHRSFTAFSAMITALSAAPRNNWSPDRKNSMPLSPKTMDWRMRPTSTS